MYANTYKMIDGNRRFFYSLIKTMSGEKHILMLGSLPNGDTRKIDLYNAIVQACQSISSTFVVKTPIDTEKFKGDVFERRKRAFQKLDQADIIIGDQTSPSTGQGIEIREIEIMEKPFIAIAQTGSKISGLVESSPALKKTIFYDDVEDVKAKLVKTLKEMGF